MPSNAMTSDAVVPELTLRHPDGRTTDYRVMTPARGQEWGVVLFSHGANASNAAYDRVWRAWTDRGYMVIGPNHIDTGPPAGRPKISSPELWRARIADIKAPLIQRAEFDVLARAHKALLNWEAVCAAGHSFGAVVAQAIAGARIMAPGEGGLCNSREPAVVACVCLSPPGPLKDFIPTDAWSTVTIPALIQTGDDDILPHFVDDWRLRLTGFAGGPNRWTIVARGVDHYFHGLICTLTQGPHKDLPALNETCELTAQFIEAYVRRDAGALEALTVRAKQGDDRVLVFAAA